MNRYFAGLTIAALTSTVSVFAGTIIVNNDEWTLSNSGFASEGSANGTAFAQNAAQYLTGSASGAKVWIDSDNFGLNGSNLQTALSGYALTDTGTFSAFTLATLQGYQAVFLGGDALTAGEESALISYVNGGGSVYIAAGTGSIGSSATEAAQWNAFLNSFGLTLATSYNGVSGNIPTASTSPILNGVSQLYYNNGNSVSVTGANAQIITQTSGQGLIGIYSPSTSSIPEPTTAFLALAVLGAFGLARAKGRS